MKLLLDENLSYRLAPQLRDLFPNIHHVRDFELLHSPDEQIWTFARQSGFAIVTTDADFFDRATAYGPPPQVIWLRNWAHSTRRAESLLRREAIRISAFLEDPTLSILILAEAKSPPPI